MFITPETARDIEEIVSPYSFNVRVPHLFNRLSFEHFNHVETLSKLDLNTTSEGEVYENRELLVAGTFNNAAAKVFVKALIEDIFEGKTTKVSWRKFPKVEKVIDKDLEAWRFSASFHSK
jgi:hypothetical protein